jgi:hypothetical protein
MTTLQTALILREAGISTIPTKADKLPLIQWRQYMQQVPTEAELAKWFARDASIALVGGAVQCLDFDEKYSAGIFRRFCLRAEEVGLDYLLGELIRQKTPSGGYHLVWRCEGHTIRNLKLASKANNECMIETRGDGGYFLISPSTGYTLEAGDWAAIPVISGDDRDALLSLARSFDERVPQEVAHHEPAPTDSALTPGDDYDARADIPGLLRKHGWKAAGGSGKYWTRPGKARGISATWGVVPNRLFVFSSSTEFEPHHVYRPWHVYAVLECGGDFKRAASELRRQGFGGSRPKGKIAAPWDDVVVGQPQASEEPAGVEPYDEPPGVEWSPESGGIDPSGAAPTKETEEDKIRRLLRARSFDPGKVPPPMRPVYSLGGVVISTPGNLTAITAQAKVGKSALVSALTAAAMTDPEAEADCLTAVGHNPAGKGLLYFDTEQSPDDFWHAVNRARRRAQVETMPGWIRAFSVADLPAVIGRKSVAVAMADAAEECGGIHSVIIDGVADLVCDVNDAEECNGLVAELHSMAIRYDCAIICVIHKNPGSEKVRGHLGSQIERKAETNLSLDKDDGCTVVWSNKQRRAPIEKETGPRFRWDDEMKMHVSVAAPETVPAATRRLIELHDMALEAYAGAKRLRYVELVEAISKSRDLSEPTAKRKVSEMRKHGIIKAGPMGLLEVVSTDLPA